MTAPLTVDAGAHQGDPPFGRPGVGGPHLLAGDQPPVGGLLGCGPKRGQVRSRGRLAEQLAPDLAGVEDARQPAGLLGRRAVREQGRSGKVDADPVDGLRGAGPGVLHVVQSHLHWSGSPATHRLRPGDGHHPGLSQLGLPSSPPIDRFLRAEVRAGPLGVAGEPPAHVQRERLLSSRQRQVHVSAGPYCRPTSSTAAGSAITPAQPRIQEVTRCPAASTAPGSLDSARQPRQRPTA